MSPAARICSARRPRSRARSARGCASELGLPISVGVARTKHLAKIASQVAKPDGLVVVDPGTELEFLHDLPVELMWGVGPVTKARLAAIGVLTIGQLANTPGWSLERAARPCRGEKLTALAWNRDPRADPDAAARAVGRRAVGARPEARDRARLPAGAAPSRRPGRLAAARQIAARPDGDGARPLRRPARGHPLGDARRADLGDGDRSPRSPRIWCAGARRSSATRGSISLLAISVSHLEKRVDLQLELPLGLADESRRPGTSEASRAGWPTARSTRSAIASAGRRSATARSRWKLALGPRRIPRTRREGSVNSQALAADPLASAGGYASQNGFCISSRASRRVSLMSARSRSLSRSRSYRD